MLWILFENNAIDIPESKAYDTFCVLKSTIHPAENINIKYTNRF